MVEICILKHFSVVALLWWLAKTFEKRFLICVIREHRVVKRHTFTKLWKVLRWSFEVLQHSCIVALLVSSVDGSHDNDWIVVMLMIIIMTVKSGKTKTNTRIIIMTVMMILLYTINYWSFQCSLTWGSKAFGQIQVHSAKNSKARGPWRAKWNLLWRKDWREHWWSYVGTKNGMPLLWG